MEEIGELLKVLAIAIAISIMSVGMIWVMGMGTVTIINALAGTCYTWNIAYSILIYAILVILLVVFTKK